VKQHTEVRFVSEEAENFLFVIYKSGMSLSQSP